MVFHCCQQRDALVHFGKGRGKEDGYRLRVEKAANLAADMIPLTSASVEMSVKDMTK